MLKLKEPLEGWNLQWKKNYTFTHVTSTGLIDTNGVEHVFEAIVPNTHKVVTEPTISKPGLK